jgi:hypothetical protein
MHRRPPLEERFQSCRALSQPPPRPSGLVPRSRLEWLPSEAARRQWQPSTRSCLYGLSWGVLCKTTVHFCNFYLFEVLSISVHPPLK